MSEIFEELRKAMEELAKVRKAYLEAQKKVKEIASKKPEAIQKRVEELSKEREKIAEEIKRLEREKNAKVAEILEEYEKKVEPLKAKLEAIETELNLYVRGRVRRARITGEKKARGPRGYKAKIIELLSSNPAKAFTAREVHEAVGTAVESRARTILEELVKEGKVEKLVEERPYKYRWIG